MTINFSHLQSLYKKQIDSILANTGLSTECEFNFGISKKLMCPNCIYDVSLKKSSGKYKSGGPISFSLGKICPYCNGVGFYGEITSSIGYLAIIWDYKKWINPPPNINNPEGFIQTICDKTYLSSIKQCKDITVIYNSEGSNPVFRLYGEPNPAGLGDNNYLFCMWEKIGVNSEPRKTPLPSPTAVTPTPTISTTPAVTPTISVTPTITPTVSATRTPTPTPSQLAQVLFDKSSWSDISSSIPDLVDYLDSASDSWSNHIKYDTQVYNIIKGSYPSWNGLSLVNFVEVNDSNAGYVAACGPVDIVDIINNDPNNIKYNSLTFQLYVNVYYYDNPLFNLDENDWIGIITHELGHALGIGTLWTPFLDYWLDGSKYSLASSAYNTIIGDTNNNRNKVPIEDAGASGTIQSHWENNSRLSSYPNSNSYNYPSCDFDIMIGFITVGDPKPISNLSKQVLIDMGYSGSIPVIPAVSIIDQQYTESVNILTNMCGSHHLLDGINLTASVNLNLNSLENKDETIS